MIKLLYSVDHPGELIMSCFVLIVFLTVFNAEYVIVYSIMRSIGYLLDV